MTYFDKLFKVLFYELINGMDQILKRPIKIYQDASCPKIFILSNENSIHNNNKKKSNKKLN